MAVLPCGFMYYPGGGTPDSRGGKQFAIFLAVFNIVAFRRQMDDKTYADNVCAFVGHAFRPGAHPFAVAPVIGAEQSHLLAADSFRNGADKRFHFLFFNYFRAHGRRTEGDDVEVGDLWL